MSTLSAPSPAERPPARSAWRTEGRRRDRSLSWRLALLSVLGLALAVRLYRLDAISFWLDESATLFYAHGSFLDIWGKDTHPPLYYGLIALWRELGEGEFILRLSSVIPSVATVWLIWLCGGVIGGRPTAALAALLQALAPFSIAYAQDLRMYPLLELYAAVALLGLLRLLREPGSVAAVPLRGPAADRAAAAVRRAWLLYGAGTALMLYGHNLGWLWPLVANAVALPLWARRPERRVLLRRWFAVNLCVLLLWLPWLPAMLGQLDAVIEAFWVQQPDLAGVLAALAHLDFGLGSLQSGWQVALALGLVLLSLWGCRVMRPRALPLLLLTAAVVPPLIAWALGWIARPLFLPRTLIWTALPCVLATAHALAWLLAPPRRTARLAAGAVLLLALLAVRTAGVVAHFAEYTRPDWRTLVARMAWEIAAGDRVAVVPGYHAISFQHYALLQAAQGRPTPPKPDNFYTAKGLLERARALAPGEGFWVVRVLSDAKGLPVPPATILAIDMPCIAVREQILALDLEATLLVAGEGCRAAP